MRKIKSAEINIRLFKNSCPEIIKICNFHHKTYPQNVLKLTYALSYVMKWINLQYECSCNLDFKPDKFD